MKIIPNSRPQMTKAESEVLAKRKIGNKLPPVVLIGVRGYYSNSMGKPDANDINMYDDAIIVFGLDTYETFNANTDPSFVKKNGRGLASLNTGLYSFYKGKHKGKYNALRAYPEGVVLPCTRDGVPSSCSAINIHKGGMNNGSAGVTWSEGCQTLPPNQWANFIELVYMKMSKYGMTTVPYILMDYKEMKSILGS